MASSASGGPPGLARACCMYLAEGTVPGERTVAARAWPTTRVGLGGRLLGLGPGSGSVALEVDN